MVEILLVLLLVRSINFLDIEPVVIFGPHLLLFLPSTCLMGRVEAAGDVPYNSLTQE